MADSTPPGRSKCWLQPPALDVLEAEHPGLGVGAVRDGRADLGIAVGVARVVPVVALAAGDVGAQVGEIVDRERAGLPVGMAGAVAPIGERPVDVDADGIDVWTGPERIEMEIHVARAVRRLVAEVFRPVGGIGDLGGGAEHGLHVGGEIRQRRDEGIVARAVAHLGEAAHLGADQEGVDATGRRGEMGIVQDEAAVGPFGRAGIDDAVADDGEIGDLRGADEGSELGGGGGSLVGLPGCWGRARR